ncbi:MAG TPA: isoprenylcysteine carboxylmethyltransferase family protein [Pirellulales bacterium]|jgi:protein-S-isoprenylcysteine O-methyltransferase Ste14|nr:isoprenylcysteine carboxylmethyltransferase family protein [Pirellulales bacterium]
MATAGISDNVGWWSRIQPWLCLAPSALTLGLALVSSPRITVGSWLQFYVDTLGWLSFVLGAALRWWCALYLASMPRTALITSGPFSICRNPMQIGNLLLGFSLVLFVASATFALGFAVGAVVCLSMVVAAEERQLARSLGNEYRQYFHRVGRFLIRPSLFQSPETLFVDAAELARELRLTAVWMWLPVVGKTLAQMRADTWWPHLLHLP